MDINKRPADLAEAMEVIGVLKTKLVSNSRRSKLLTYDFEDNFFVSTNNVDIVERKIKYANDEILFS